MKCPLVCLAKPLLVSLGMLAFGGCASGPDRSAAASSSLKATRETITLARAQIDVTLATLNGLVSQASGDLRPGFERFRDQIPQNRAWADRITRRADKMRFRGDEYFQKWEEELAYIHNVDIRNLGQERRAKMLESYNRASGQMRAARDAYGAFMSDLLDIQRFLANDLTRQGVAAIAKTVTKTNDDAATVSQKLDNVVLELDRLAAAFSSK